MGFGSWFVGPQPLPTNRTHAQNVHECYLIGFALKTLVWVQLKGLIMQKKVANGKCSMLAVDDGLGGFRSLEFATPWFKPSS